MCVLFSYIYFIVLFCMRARALAVELNRLKADLVDLDRCIAILQANEDAVQHQQLLQLPPASSSSALGSSPSRHAQPQTLQPHHLTQMQKRKHASTPADAIDGSEWDADRQPIMRDNDNEAHDRTTHDRATSPTPTTSGPAAAQQQQQQQQQASTRDPRLLATSPRQQPSHDSDRSAPAPDSARKRNGQTKHLSLHVGEVSSLSHGNLFNNSPDHQHNRA